MRSPKIRVKLLEPLLLYGEPCAVGDVVDVPDWTARELVVEGRAQYVMDAARLRSASGLRDPKPGCRK